MRTIRASEIGSYLYCHRAWYYQRQGFESSNQVELASGTKIHDRHGRNVLANSCLQVVAYFLLIAAAALVTFYLIGMVVK